MKALLGALEAWEVTIDGFEEPTDTAGYTAAQNKALKETRSKDKMALYMLFRTVDESGFEKIVDKFENIVCAIEESKDLSMLSVEELAGSLEAHEQ
ncbi:hypothetical protein A2U01_0045249, partial [Trifolium medium]|nr:hypothetical protein [Trifolium medium]